MSVCKHLVVKLVVSLALLNCNLPSYLLSCIYSHQNTSWCSYFSANIWNLLHKLWPGIGGFYYLFHSHIVFHARKIFSVIYSTSLIIFDVIFSFIMMDILGLFSAQYIEKIRLASQVCLSTWSNLGVGFLVQSIYLHCI